MTDIRDDTGSRGGVGLCSGGIGLCRLSADGTLLHVDRRAFVILGLADRHPDETALIGRPLVDVVRDCGGEGFRLPESWDDPVPCALEFRVPAPGGQVKWIAWDAVPAPTGQDAGPSIWLTLCDITHHKQLEAALSTSVSNYRTIFDAANDAIFVHDPQTGAILEVNQAMSQMYGYSPDEARSLTVGDISSGEHPYSQAQALEKIRLADKRGPQLFDWLCKDRTGRLFWTEVSLKNVLLGGQERVLAIVRDIDDRKRVQRALADSENLYRMIMENINDGLCIQDENGKILFVNHKVCEITGYSREELIGRNGLDLLDKSERKIAEEQLLLSREGHHTPYEMTISSKDGRKVQLLVKPSARRDPDGRYLGSCVLVVDITQRKQAEEAQRREHQQLLSIFDSIDELIYVADSDTCRILFANRVLTKRFGEVVGKICHEALRGMDQPCPDCPLEHILETKLADTYVSEWQDQVNGRWYRSLNKVIRWTGDRLALLCLATDLTDRIQAELALREKEENLRTTLDSIGDAVVVTDAQGVVTRMNPVAEQLLGCDLETAKDRNLSQVLQLMDAQSRQPLENPAERVLREGKTTRLEEQTFLITKDGMVRRIAASGAPIRSDEGDIIGCVLVFRDITEKYWMEEQLIMSRKMESLGRLAGGISHDFQNLLGTIRGYCDLIQLDLNRADPLRKDLGEIQKAADLGLELVEQLLAFSRKQVLHPRVLDLNEIIHKLERMLRRLIGEDIELILQLATFLEQVRVDPGKMEQVIMTLVLNAREAMPEGGKLIVSTSNRRLEQETREPGLLLMPGNYVVVAVTDTGIGMSSQASRMVFEPFFTTKEPGEGTGMGLATAFGMVRQSGGTIRVVSEPDRGATFEVYLPVADIPATEEQGEVGASLHRGTETVLLVEDEQLLRNLLVKTLDRIGYRVLPAAHGEEALEMAQAYPHPIDLVLTDVVLPHLNGPELATHLRRMRPDLRVLFMSAYPDRTIVPDDLQAQHVGFIKKPFTIREIAAKVRMMLSA